MDTLYLLGTSVCATLTTLAPPSPASTASPILASTTQENPVSNIPMLCLLWYHPFVAAYHAQDAKSPTDAQRSSQKLRPNFASHTRRDPLSHLSDKGQHRVRSFSNPHLRLTIPTPPISSSIQFMACKSIRHALMILANRQYSVRTRGDDSISLGTSPHRPHSPNVQSTNPNWSPTSTRPASPSIDRRHSLQPSIAQHIVGNLESIQRRVVSLIVGILENSNNTTATNDDRLIVCHMFLIQMLLLIQFLFPPQVAACELLVIISVGDWTNTSDVVGHSQVIGQVFQWMARLSHSRKSKIEGQLLSALHPHLIKFVQRIPISNLAKSDTAITLACYLVPLIPSHADPVLQVSLLDAIAAALDKLPLEREGSNSFFDLDNLRLLCSLCTKWLVKLVSKPLEGSVLRSALGVLHRVARVVLAYNVSSEAILSHIFKSIAVRLAPFIPHSPVATMPLLDTLSIHSNEIVQSWDGRDRDMDSDFDERETEDEEDDDWDDEDDTTGGEVVVGELTTFLHIVKAAEASAVSKILLMLPTHERSVLSW